MVLVYQTGIITAFICGDLDKESSQRKAIRRTGKLEGGPFSALTQAKSLGTKLGTKQAQHLVEDGHFNALTGLHSVSGRSLDSPSGLVF